MDIKENSNNLNFQEIEMNKKYKSLVKSKSPELMKYDYFQHNFLIKNLLKNKFNVYDGQIINFNDTIDALYQSKHNLYLSFIDLFCKTLLNDINKYSINSLALSIGFNIKSERFLNNSGKRLVKLMNISDIKNIDYVIESDDAFDNKISSFKYGAFKYFMYTVWLISLIKGDKKYNNSLFVEDYLKLINVKVDENFKEKETSKVYENFNTDKDVYNFVYLYSYMNIETLNPFIDYLNEYIIGFKLNHVSGFIETTDFSI